MRASSVAVAVKSLRRMQMKRTRETEARWELDCDRWCVGKACAWFLTKPSAISSKHPAAKEFFAYPQEVWISLWMIGPDARSGAHR